jgi:hypothetical protein
VKTKNDMVSVMPHLAYYKTGDDFVGFLEKASGNVSAAYTAWADSLAESVEDLRKIAAILKDDTKAGGDGGANSLFLFVSPKTAETLIKADLAQLDPCPGEEDD